MRIIGWVVLLLVLAFIVGIVGHGLGVIDWFVNDPKNGAIAVAQDEFNARELLKKYEWFKNAAGTLDSRSADIKIYEQKVDRLSKRENLDRVDREQLLIWEQELAGIKSSYNQLAGEYNAQMAKFNWRFCNAGTLPQGATETLPREFRQYQEK